MQTNNHKKPLLLTDCDGVLLRWSAHLPAFLKSVGICTKHLDGLLHGNQMIPYQILFPADTKEKSMELMMNYNHSEFVSRLPIMEPASNEILKRLNRYVDIVVITNISDLPSAASLRRKNLEDVYGNIFEDVICLKPHSDKTSVIKKLVQSRNVILWIDDSLQHVQEGLSVGAPSLQFTYDMQCGRNTGNVSEIASWSQIEEYIITHHLTLPEMTG